MHGLVGRGGDSGSSTRFPREESVGSLVAQLQDGQENDHAQVCGKKMTKHRGRDRPGGGRRRGKFPLCQAEVEDRLTETTHWVVVLMGQRALGAVIMELQV